MRAFGTIRLCCAVAMLTPGGIQRAIAQQAPPSALATSSATTETKSPGTMVTSTKTETSAESHRFWDRKNDWLFAGTAASRALDYFSTLNMRRRGRQEILLSNDAVDNHAAFTAIEAAATAVSIGTSYLFHRYGHHKLERWTSAVHISLATTGAIRNYSLKTAHPATVP